MNAKIRILLIFKVLYYVHTFTASLFLFDSVTSGGILKFQEMVL